MDWRAEGEAIRQQVEGIITLLLALAVIAERAAGAPFRVKVQILSILVPAELFARDYVCDETGAPALQPAQDGCAFDDAKNLAARFRLLAVVLAGLVTRLLADRRFSQGILWSRIAGDAAGVARARSFARRAIDTS